MNRKTLLFALTAIGMMVALVFARVNVSAAERCDVRIGEIISFGHYPQTETGNDLAPIDWLVLDVKEDRVLVISRYALDSRPYNDEQTEITWEKCSLRRWLNEEFPGLAFSAEEREDILLTNVDNSVCQGFDFTAVSCYAEENLFGNDTQDTVFLLSFAEAERYFSVKYWGEPGAIDNLMPRVHPTAYAVRQGAFEGDFSTTLDGAAAGWWWLRSPGCTRSDAAYISYDGALYDNGVSDPAGSVRPALWVKPGAGIF